MIKLKKISKKFNNNYLFKDLSLEINENELTFILGKSGSGKTTLLNLIGKIDRIDSGSIVFENSNPTIDFVFQDYNLVENLTLKDNLKLGLNIVGKEFNKNDFNNYLEDLNIHDKSKDTKMEKLSGGERQRVAIIRALSRNSDIILADEPTGNLDSKNSTKIFEIFKKISKTKTIVIVTHDEENARKYADRIIEIEDGNIKNTESFKQEEKNLIGNKFPGKKIEKKYSNLNKLSIAPKILKKDFKKKIFQFFLIFLSIILSLTTIGIISQSSTNQSQISNQTNINYLQTDKINVSPNADKSLGIDSFLTKDQILEIEKDFEIEKIISQFSNFSNVYNLFLSPNSTESFQLKDKFYQSVDNSDFFAKRLNFKDKNGNLLHLNSGEIILGQNVINQLKIENPIGKKIYIKDPVQSQNIELTIIEVNTIKNPLNNYLSYVNFNDLNKIKETIILNEAGKEKQIFILELLQKKPGFDFLDSINAFKLQYDKNLKLEDVVIINGKNIENSWEVLLSSDLKEEYDKSFNSVMSKVTQQLSSSYQLKPEIKVVGWFEANAPNQIIIKNDDFNYLKTLQDVYHEFYLSNNSEIKTFNQKVSQINQNVNSIDNLNQLSIIFNNSTQITKNILIIFLVIIIILMFVFVATFSKALVDSKRKEIGILKVLGGSNKLIAFFHINNILVINLVAYIFSIILYAIIAPYIGSLIFNINVQVDIGLNIGWISIAWISILVITAIIYYLFSIRTFRKTTIDLLR